jgi:hypothetical protein
MDMAKLLLKKDELPVIEYENSWVSFLPIYPKLLRKDAIIKTNISKLLDGANRQTQDDIGFVRNNYFEITFMENGLLESLLITPNSGIVFRKDKPYILPKTMGKEKIELYLQMENTEYIVDGKSPFGYEFKETKREYATFLRNLGVLYLNSALRQIKK